MQTLGEIQGKISEMAQNLPAKIAAETQRLVASGALNLDEASDDFRLPKLLYVQALRNIADSYRPLDVANKAELRNLAKH